MKLMSTLCLVPHQALARKWRQPLQDNGGLLPFSLTGLVSHLLKEQSLPYRESQVLEQLSVWESVWEVEDQLEFYAPLKEFPGFISDLHLMFARITAGAVDADALIDQQRDEIKTIYQRYIAKLTKLQVLDRPMQMRQALEFWPQSSLFAEVEAVEIYYLGSLTPLEEQFVQAITTNKSVRHLEFDTQNLEISGQVARNYSEEIEHVAQAIFDLIKSGVQPEKIAVASPDLGKYYPLITPVFSAYNITWRTPTVNLSAVSLGKAIAGLLSVMQGNASKRDLTNLVAVGWGLPFKLSYEERQALKMAAPQINSLHRWQETLSSYSGWQEVFQFLSDLQVNHSYMAMSQHITKIKQVLRYFPIQTWPVDSMQAWGELVQAWDGLDKILTNFDESGHRVTLAQFSSLLIDAFANYTLPQSVSFLQQVTVSSLEQIIGMDYDTVFLIGMTENSFPYRPRYDWLTKTFLPDHSMELWEQLQKSVRHLHLSFADADQDGKAMIGSRIFPQDRTRLPARTVTKSGDTIQFGDGVLDTKDICAAIRERYTQRPLSVSRLNIYVSCPFRFLCSEFYQLREDETDSDELTAPEEGNIIHEALRLFWQQLGNIPITDILAQVYQERQQEVPNRVERMLVSFSKKDQALVTSSEYTPAHLEHRFQGLVLDTSFGPVQLHGIMDRVDIHPNGNYVVYDYKTGFNPSTNDILTGQDLQLQFYLLAAKAFLPADKIQGIAFYNVKYGRRVGVWSETEYKQLGLTKRNGGILPVEEWDRLEEQFRHTIQEYLEKIFSGYFPIKPINDRICTFCAYAGICRKEG